MFWSCNSILGLGIATFRRGIVTVFIRIPYNFQKSLLQNKVISQYVQLQECNGDQDIILIPSDDSCSHT